MEPEVSRPLADRDDMLGLLTEEYISRMPDSWNVFARVRVYANGPVIFVYDLGVSREKPVYIFSNGSLWNEAVTAPDGVISYMGGMYFGEAQRHVATLLGDA